MTATETELLARCSFCKKDHTEVQKLIAGPGVYICDECIALCNDILAEPIAEEVPKRNRITDLSPDELLTRIRGVSGTASELEADLARWVRHARDDHSIEWDRLADALGTTRDAARERFGRTSP